MADIFDLFAKISKENSAKAKAPIEWLLVGLGNPGRDYVNTRHNAGFMAMDHIAARCGVFAKTDIQPLINEGVGISSMKSSMIFKKTQINFS